jgi:esterase/lipase superfamily enzyme
MRRFFSLVLALLLANTASSACPAQASTRPTSHTEKQDWNKQIGWVTVPVFYVTDRHLNVQSGELDYSEQQSTDGLSYGVKNITIPLTAHLNNYSKQLKKMGWHILSMEGQPEEKFVNSADLQFPNRTYNRQQFFEALDKATDLSDRRELLLHIHGCCVTYKNSMVNAAKLEGFYRVPIVLYDWTSPDFGPLKLPEYLKNEGNVKVAQSQFNEFADALEQHMKPQQMAISAHSMGNRLLDSFMTSRYYRWGGNADHPRFKETIFASADVDAKTFATGTTKTTYNSRITRIYISGQDPALMVSELVHGAASRLGRPGKVLPSLCQTDKMDVIDETELYIKHDLPEWLIANMHRYGRAGERDSYDVLQKGNHFYIVKERKR